MNVRLAPAARDDLDAIWLHIAEDSGSEAVATRVLDALTGRFALFAQFPLIGHMFEAARISDLRVFSVDRYLIFYRPLGNEVRILRVVHGSRDILSVLGEEE